MRRHTLAVFVAASVFMSSAIAANSPSEAGAVSVVGGSVALSLAPSVIVAGSVVLLAESFHATVTAVSAINENSTRTVKAKDEQGREVTVHVPQATFAANPVAPGDAIAGEKTYAGLLITAHGRPLVLAPTTPAQEGLSKHKPL